MNTIDFIEFEQMKKNIPVFKVGDTVKVHVKIVEGDKQRIQAYQGVVISRQKSIQHDCQGRTDRQMIVVGATGDRFKDCVCRLKQLIGKPPAGTQHQQTRLPAATQPVTQGGK